MNYFILILKGVAMGAANVIPGVSGGTMALITGIFERLIDAIKSFNIQAIKLLFSFKLKEFAKYTDLYFLLAVFGGIAVAIITLAKLFDYLFTNYPVYIWAYFFGLVLASVYFVGKTVKSWNKGVVITFIIGTTIAVIISVMNPATENSGTFYLLLCGAVAMCSMILPGLSGSFVLILMGNYQLVMIDAVNDRNLAILIPVGIGAVLGLLAFSHILSWVFKRFRDQTISLLTGFILGSLSVLWPWKNSIDFNNNIININKFGAYIDTAGEVLENVKVSTYNHVLPASFNSVVLLSILFAIAGIISIWAIEKASETKS